MKHTHSVKGASAKLHNELHFDKQGQMRKDQVALCFYL